MFLLLFYNYNKYILLNYCYCTIKTIKNNDQIKTVNPSYYIKQINIDCTVTWTTIHVKNIKIANVLRYEPCELESLQIKHILKSLK